MECKAENGWDLFSIDTYFMKMFQKTEDWRLSSVNNDYKVWINFKKNFVYFISLISYSNHFAILRNNCEIKH